MERKNDAIVFALGAAAGTLVGVWIVSRSQLPRLLDDSSEPSADTHEKGAIVKVKSTLTASEMIARLPKVSSNISFKKNMLGGWTNRSWNVNVNLLLLFSTLCALTCRLSFTCTSTAPSTSISCSGKPKPFRFGQKAASFWWTEHLFEEPQIPPFFPFPCLIFFRFVFPRRAAEAACFQSTSRFLERPSLFAVRLKRAHRGKSLSAWPLAKENAPSTPCSAVLR